MDLPKGWATLPFRNVAIKVSIINENKIKQRDYLTDGILPVIDPGAEFIDGYTNDENKTMNCILPAIVFGDHTKVVKFVNRCFCAGADGITYTLGKGFSEANIRNFKQCFATDYLSANKKRSTDFREAPKVIRRTVGS